MHACHALRERDTRVALPEVVIEQPHVAVHRIADGLARAIAMDMHDAAPALQQRRERLQRKWIVVDRKHAQPVQGRSGRRCRRRAARQRRHPRHLHAEYRAAPHVAAHLHARAEQSRDAIRDGQAETEPLPRRVLATTEFLEQPVDMVWGDARSGVAHLDAQPVPAAPRAKDDAAARGVAHRIGQEVLQHPAQQRGIGMRPRIAMDITQRQPLGRRDRPELRRQRVEQFAHRDIACLRLQAARIEPRHVEQAAEQVLRRIQRTRQLRDDALLRTGIGCLRKRIGEQLRRVQRLHQVMADGREEACLGLVRALGVERGDLQFARALCNARLK